jgi:hypothetical protein
LFLTSHTNFYISFLFLEGLKEGRRYKFAVFGTFNNSIEVMSKISRHMTACDDDDDCYGEKICSASYKCVAPEFSKTMAMWITAFLLFITILGYVWLRSYVENRNGRQDEMLSLDEKHPKMIVEFDGIIVDDKGDKMFVKNIPKQKFFKWKRDKELQKIFPLDKFQHAYCMTFKSMDNPKETCSFMCERFIGGGGFGRVFLLRPVDTSSKNYKNKQLKACREGKFLKGRCMGIKYLEIGTDASEVDMIKNHLDYHKHVSRPRLWLQTGFSNGGPDVRFFFLSVTCFSPTKRALLLSLLFLFT